MVLMGQDVDEEKNNFYPVRKTFKDLFCSSGGNEFLLALCACGLCILFSDFFLWLTLLWY